MGLIHAGKRTHLSASKNRKVGFHDLLDGLNVIIGNELVVCVKKLDASFLKCPLGKQQLLELA